MSCDVCEVTEWLENELCCGSPGDVSEEPVTLETQNKGWRMSCDVGEARKGCRMSCDVGKATEGLENEL